MALKTKKVKQICNLCDAVYTAEVFGPGDGLTRGNPHNVGDCILTLRRRMDALDARLEGLEKLLEGIQKT